MMEILFVLAIFAASFFGAILGNYVWHRRKWRVHFDEESNKLELEVDKPGGKIEYVADATQDELDEMNQPSWLKQVVNKVVRKNNAE